MSLLSPGRYATLAAAVSALVSTALAPPTQATTLNTLCAPQDDPCIVDQAIGVDPGSVFDLGGRSLLITSSGSLDVGTGLMTLVGVDALILESGGELTASGSTAAAGGTIEASAATMNIGGTIDASGNEPGNINLIATGEINLTGRIAVAALARTASGGVVDIEAGSFRLLGVIDADGGSEDSLGGDVEVGTTGDLRVEGEISVLGPDGGTVALTAGIGLGGGNVVMTSSSRVLADAIFQGGFGEGIDITANGDGVSTGFITADGELTVDGDTAGEEFGGGSGGCLSLTADGDLINTDPTAEFSTTGGGPDGDGGELELVSNAGRVSIAGLLDASAVGNEGGGGAIAIDAARSIEVLGEVDVTGGDGGEVALSSTEAGVTVGEEASIVANGRDIGGGGVVCLESATVASGQSASVLIQGDVQLNGGSVGGDGGSIDVIALDSARLTSTINAIGGLGGGAGGSVGFSANGPVVIEGTIIGRGRGAGGGSVAIDGASIDMLGDVDVSGAGASMRDTDIGLDATAGAIRIAGTLNATSNPGAGGLVQVNSVTGIVITGTLTATGGAEPGGRVDVNGCAVLLCGFNAAPEQCQGATGVLRTLGPNGLNRITGRQSADVFGNMTAAVSGANEVVVRPPFAENAFVLGEVVPPVTPVEADLPTCTGCGNGVTENPPEECDDGNNEDGDGCSAQCRIEDEALGDVNGDGNVNLQDLTDLAKELFDGDGDRIEDVSSPSFPGTAASDTNLDRRITVADFVGLIPEL